MLIRKSRIRSIDPHLKALEVGAEFILGVRLPDGYVGAELSRFGFSEEWAEGETVLPPAHLGPTCLKNAEGWEIVHKDQEMETAYREFDWTWTEWHGRYNQVENSKTVYQPYERYPRTFVPPPSIELSTVTTPQGPMVVVAQAFSLPKDSEPATFAANVLLELFGEVEVLGADLKAVLGGELKRVNWEVLPMGEHPWKTLAPKIEPILRNKGERKRPVFERRWQKIAEFGPEFVAVGRAGFSGYLIFAFPERNLYVLESANYGNATYVLDENWQKLSRRSKGELLNEGLHRDRLIHYQDWANEIDSLFEDDEDL